MFAGVALGQEDPDCQVPDAEGVWTMHIFARVLRTLNLFAHEEEVIRLFERRVPVGEIASTVGLLEVAVEKLIAHYKSETNGRERWDDDAN